LSAIKKLFHQTAIYGLATVLPRMFSFFLTPIHTGVLEPAHYGSLSVFYANFAIFNVVLAYGMETAFFRFFNQEPNKPKVIATSLLSMLTSSMFFLVLGLSIKPSLTYWINVPIEYLNYFIFILVFDALAVIPFAYLRAKGRAKRYAWVKITSVALNLGLNAFFLLLLPNMSDSFMGGLYKPNFEVEYIFIANLIPSALTLLLVGGIYIRSHYYFDLELFERMIKYAFPVLIAGIAFTINEVMDRIILSELLPPDLAEDQIGKYSACYKLAMFMTFFATAFRLGIEPFFFSHANNKNPQKAYAMVTNYFVVIGSVILLATVVFSDWLKHILLRDEAYFEAMGVVPILLLAAFCLGIYHNLSVWYKVTDRTRWGAYISLVGAALTLIINFVFIPKYGFMASAWATLAAYGSMALLSYFIGKRYYPVPYNNRKIVFYMSVSVLLSIIAFYGFNRNVWLGIPLLLAFLALTYKLEHQNIRKILQKT
jgi:O-antigen/teichoic acid export membrane protein